MPPSSRPVAHSLAVLLATILAALALAVGAPAPAGALPPGIPSASSAQSQLNALTVRTEGSMTGFLRSCAN